MRKPVSILRIPAFAGMTEKRRAAPGSLEPMHYPGVSSRDIRARSAQTVADECHLTRGTV